MKRNQSGIGHVFGGHARTEMLLEKEARSPSCRTRPFGKAALAEVMPSSG